jgi:hypothetical protein
VAEGASPVSAAVFSTASFTLVGISPEARAGVASNPGAVCTAGAVSAGAGASAEKSGAQVQLIMASNASDRKKKDLI